MPEKFICGMTCIYLPLENPKQSWYEIYSNNNISCNNVYTVYAFSAFHCSLCLNSLSKIWIIDVPLISFLIPIDLLIPSQIPFPFWWCPFSFLFNKIFRLRVWNHYCTQKTLPTTALKIKAYRFNNNLWIIGHQPSSTVKCQTWP